MIDKIYIVTSGSYSDYQIERCFLNKSDANKYLEEMDEESLRYNAIEEHNLFNSPIETRKFWRVSVYSEEPSYDEIIIISEEASVKKRSEIDKYDIIWKMSKEEFDKEVERKKAVYGVGAHIGWVTSYVSEEHCKKLAVELYQEWLRRFV
jgi:hypothetical protein